MGPPAWDFLHSVTVDYPEDPTPEEQEAAQKLVTSLKTMLPCGKCRKHFGENIGKLSPENDYFTSKQKFGQFFVDVRKAVATATGAPTIKGIKVDDYDFDKVQSLYGTGASCGGKPHG